jgi:hypothetical protein
MSTFEKIARQSFFPPRCDAPTKPLDPKAFGLDRIAYRVEVALDLLSISRSAFYALVKEGRLPIIKNGRRSIVLAVDLANLLREMRSDGGIPSRPRKPARQATEASPTK